MTRKWMIKSDDFIGEFHGTTKEVIEAVCQQFNIKGKFDIIDYALCGMKLVKETQTKKIEVEIFGM